MDISANTINDLKAGRHYFAAGALAYSLGNDCIYDCHFGMRSTLDDARSQYIRGWKAAKLENGR